MPSGPQRAPDALRLTPEVAARRLRGHPAWVVERDRLRRDVRLADFAAAMALVNAAGEVAEGRGHHPNIRLHEWCFVEFEVYSHITGGLTERDVGLALALEEVIAAHAPS